MIKKFLNEDGNSTGAQNVIIFFTISLIFTSVVVAWMLVNIYGVSVSGITIPDITGGKNLDFTSSTTDTSSVNEHGGAWTTISGEGKVSTTANSYIVMNGIYSSNDHTYTNDYYLYNPNKLPYSIVLEYQDNNNRVLEIIVDENGYYIPRYGGSIIDGIFGNNMFSYSSSGASSIVNAHIKTVYNPEASINDDMLKFYMNDELIFTADSFAGQHTGFNINYGGVGNKNNIGLTISNFVATNDRAQTADWTTFLTTALAFCVTLVKTLTWGIDPIYLPTEINILFIKSQEIAIGIGLLFLWRS